MNKNTLIAIFFYLILAFVFCAPIFLNLNYWGQYDWDDLFYCGVERETLLKYHQIPLWNPYVGGGNLMLAHPHSSFLSPFFMPILIFGELIGAKINIFIFLFLGMVGMYILSKELNLSGFASLLPGVIFMCSSCYPLRMLVGHIFDINMVWIPWIFFFYLRSFKRKIFIIFAGLFFGFVISGGSAVVSRHLILVLPLYGILKSFQTKSLKPIYLTAFLFIITFLLTAIKTFPMLEFVLANRRTVATTQGVSFSVIKQILLNRNYFNMQQNVFGNWFEISGYIGLIPFILSIIGFLFRFKKNWPLFAVGAVTLLLIMGDNSFFNVWVLIHKFFPFESIHTPGRFIVIIIFILALFSGFGLFLLEIKMKQMKGIVKVVAGGLCLFVVLDLYLANFYIFNKIFIVTPPLIERDTKFSQYKNAASFLFERNCLYPLFLKNNGAVEGYENVYLKTGDVIANLYDDNKMKYWAAIEFFPHSKPKIKFLDFTQADFSYLDKEKNIGEWEIVRPVPGFDNKTYQYYFEEKHSESSNWHLGYILFSVYSPSSRAAVIQTGGVTGISLWVNRKKVFDSFGTETKRKGAKINILLQQGWNSFLFQIYELAYEYRKWGIGISKIADFNSNIYQDLIYDVLRGRSYLSEQKSDYKGEAYLAGGYGKVDIDYFSPNKLIIQAKVDRSDTLLVNQNFHYGWKVKDFSVEKDIKLKPFPYMGLLGVDLPKGKHKICFQFLPRLFIVGAAVSIFTLLSCILYLRNIGHS